MGTSPRPDMVRRDTRVIRTRVANAMAVARGGGYATAERMLREALGILEGRASTRVPPAPGRR